MVVKSFIFANTPQIIFGVNKIQQLAKIIDSRSKKVLLITGNSSFVNSEKYQELINNLQDKNINFFNVRVKNEPSPKLVDQICKQYYEKEITLVVAIGGGSVIDTGKAVSAMLTQKNSVMDYLEGVGAGKEHNGEKIPFIAVPTTSGTGSEASKNAVLSQVGENGFKKSLRHDNFIPDIALIDPSLTISCPIEITAASGLDALTQLIEAYTSTNSSIMTDSLIENALHAFKVSFMASCSYGQQDEKFRAGMAYASLISGIALANAGLGIVHGLASPLGGFFEIPHGVVCASLLGAATKINIKYLTEKKDEYYLKKYAEIGLILSSDKKIEINTKAEIRKYCANLIDTLDSWIEKLDISRLSDYGIKEKDLSKVVKKASNKNNPFTLNNKQIKELLMLRL